MKKIVAFKEKRIIIFKVYVKIKPKYAESIETKILFSRKWIFELILPPPNFRDSVLFLIV